MKTKSIILAALIVFGAAFATVAQTATGLAVVPVKGAPVYKVIYKGEKKGTAKLNIFDANQVLVFSETVAEPNGFILPLNFSKMNAGEYKVELTAADGKKTSTIVYGAETPANFIHVSKLTKEQGKYLISVRNAEVITVKIYGRNGLIYNESKSLEGDFAQVYAVKVPGEVTFEITDANGNVKTARF